MEEHAAVGAVVQIELARIFTGVMQQSSASTYHEKVFFSLQEVFKTVSVPGNKHNCFRRSVECGKEVFSDFL